MDGVTNYRNYPHYYGINRPPQMQNFTTKNNTNLFVNRVGNTRQPVFSNMPLGLGSEINPWTGTMIPQPPSPAQQAAMSSGGGGGGYYVQTAPPPPASPPPLTWSETYSLEGAPSWWKGMTPSQLTPETELASIMNSLIPYMTEEDQRQFATSLSSLFPKAFGHYSPEQTNFPTPTPKVGKEQTQYMLSQQRAGSILNALGKMQQATGKKEEDFGPGYKYMRNLASVMSDYGSQIGASGPTRRQVIDMYSAFDPLLSEAQGEKLGAFGELARSLAQPFYGAGKLVNVSRDDSGNWVFGKRNKSWF